MPAMMIRLDGSAKKPRILESEKNKTDYPFTNWSTPFCFHAS
jgi:hypothetical protein